MKARTCARSQCGRVSAFEGIASSLADLPDCRIPVEMLRAAAGYGKTGDKKHLLRLPLEPRQLLWRTSSRRFRPLRPGHAGSPSAGRRAMECSKESAAAPLPSGCVSDPAGSDPVRCAGPGTSARTPPSGRPASGSCRVISFCIGARAGCISRKNSDDAGLKNANSTIRAMRLRTRRRPRAGDRRNEITLSVPAGPLPGTSGGMRSRATMSGHGRPDRPGGPRGANAR